MLGGRVRLIPCGAAPFKQEVLQFFRAALGAMVLEVATLSLVKSIEISSSVLLFASKIGSHNLTNV